MKDVGNFTNRPWGGWEVLHFEEGLYKVKRLTIIPGQSISHQFHRCRTETWIVVQGHGTLIKGDMTLTVQAGDHFHIPVMVPHKVTNTGTNLFIAIEVQTGKYLEEDDIVRTEPAETKTNEET